MAYRKIELNVGESITIKCVEDDGTYGKSCCQCIFNPCVYNIESVFRCSAYQRKDSTSVHFEKVEVEDKEL